MDSSGNLTGVADLSELVKTLSNQLQDELRSLAACLTDDRENTTGRVLEAHRCLSLSSLSSGGQFEPSTTSSETEPPSPYTRVVRCIVLAQDMASQTAIVLDTLDAKITTLQNYPRSTVCEVIKNDYEANEKELRDIDDVCLWSRQLRKSPILLESQATMDYTREDPKDVASYASAMQQGSWFFRVVRRFGPIGRAFKSSFCKRVFVWLSGDYRTLFCSRNKPRSLAIMVENDSYNRQNDDDTKESKRVIVALPLHSVISFEYGEASRAYKLQEVKSGNCQPPHLCFSLRTKRQDLDLITLNETEIDRWYCGLNSLLPFFPGRIIITDKEFLQLTQKLKYACLQQRRLSMSLESCNAEIYNFVS